MKYERLLKNNNPVRKIARIKKYAPKPSTRSQDVRLSQVFSKLAYEKDDERSKQLAKTNPDYKYDPKLSTREHAIFTNPTSHKTVIAYRGTDFSDKKRWHKDLKSDLMIGMGMQGLDPRHRQANRTYDKVKKAMPGYEVSVTGHSLGGSLANHVAKNRKSSDKAVAFSRGSGPMDLLKKKSNKVLDVSNRYDPISMFARLQNKTQGKEQSINKMYNPQGGGSNLIGHHIDQTINVKGMGKINVR